MKLALTLLLFLPLLGTCLTELNVHLVCHTHDDVGWLKTVDQYYSGTADEYQHARVQYIIDSVIESLQKDPRRKFIYVEIAFFSRWWAQQTVKTQKIVRNLVSSGQLEFINGGWCMNDEASTYYESIIDQMSLGHEWLMETFGIRPRIAWHIDPFGHSSTQASLFASMGFDAFFFGRIDYQDKNQRLKDKTMEMIWRPSPSLGKRNQIFTGELFEGYGPPPGFCFDQGCSDNPLQPDKSLFDYDLDLRAESFADYVREQASHYRDNNIILTMGSDFQYENANEWYKNLDILIDYFTENHEQYKLNLFYSTPSIYLDSKHKSNISWPLKTDDFFPYSDNPASMWTGYFTSRAGFKAYERKANAELQVCRRMEILRDVLSGQTSPHSSLRLSKALGVAQHHDAVSGTAKQHVNDDYTKRLYLGIDECDKVANEALRSMFKHDLTFERCHLMNETICPASTTFKEFLEVVVYNPIGRDRSEYLHVPVSSSKVAVVDGDGKSVPVQVKPVGSKYIASFKATVPKFHTGVFHVTKTTEQIGLVDSVHVCEGDLTLCEPFTIENEYFKLTFNPQLQKVYLKKLNKEIEVKQEWMWYESFPGVEGDDQASGAYIFRPIAGASPKTFQVNGIRHATGEMFTEVHMEYKSITQIIRVFEGSEYIEVEYTVGPLDVTDSVGKEVVMRLSTDLETGSKFYTDSNGREMVTRVRDHRETWKYVVDQPISGNYYPVNSRILIKDEKKGLGLVVMTDRSQGGSSLSNGQVELMVHRRMLHDDGRGVGEPLNENIVTNGKFRVYIGPIENVNELHRLFGETIAHPLVPYFVKDSKVKVKSSKGRELMMELTESTGFPENIHFLSLEQRGSMYLVRLAHLFAVGESKVFSKPVTIDLSKFGMNMVKELTLSGNHDIESYHALDWKVDHEVDSEDVVYLEAFSNTVTLHPMEIRTFLVQFSSFE